MTNKTTVIALTLLLCCSAAMAMPPMGPPRSLLEPGQVAIGGEYGRLNTDLQAFGVVKEDQDPSASISWVCSYEKIKIKNLKSNMIFGTVAYGLCENWDVFARVGISDGKDDMYFVDCNGTKSNTISLDGDFGVAGGGGIRFTVCQAGDVTWGGICQMTYVKPGDTTFQITDSTTPTLSMAGTMEMSYLQVQAAFGPTVQFGDNMWLYGGPFVSFVDGDLDMNATWSEGTASGPVVGNTDLREESWIGAYCGAQWNPGDSTTIYVEGQMTADSWGIGIGAMLMFE